MKTLKIAGITEMGSHIYTEIRVREDYAMNEVVKEVKRLGYKYFRLTETMKAYAEAR